MGSAKENTPALAKTRPRDCVMFGEWNRKRIGIPDPIREHDLGDSSTSARPSAFLRCCYRDVEQANFSEVVHKSETMAEVNGFEEHV